MSPEIVSRIDVDQAAQRLEVPEAERPLVLDVREAYEHDAVRVPGSLLVPLSEFAQRIADVPADRPLLVMCAAGRRSLVAADFLQRAGHRDVASVDGGIVAWERAGHPVERGAPDP